MSESKDLWARVGAGVSIAISLAAAFFAWASGPYYYASPDQLAYRTYYDLHREDDGRIWAELTVYVQNRSATPARNLHLQLVTRCQKASLTSSHHSHQQQSTGPDGRTRFNVSLPSVPAKSTAHIDLAYTLNEWFNEVRAHRQKEGIRQTFVSDDYETATKNQAYVIDVCVERGSVSRDPSNEAKVRLSAPNYYGSIADYKGPWE